MANPSGILDEYKRRCSAWGIVTPIRETLILHKPDFGFKCRLGTFWRCIYSTCHVLRAGEMKEILILHKVGTTSLHVLTTQNKIMFEN